MKRNRLAALCGVAAVCIFGVAATTSIAAEGTVEAEPLAASQDSASASKESVTVTSQTVYEVNTETGEILQDGKPAGNLGDAGVNVDGTYVISEEDGRIVTIRTDDETGLNGAEPGGYITYTITESASE